MPLQIIDSDRLYRKIARMISTLIAKGEFVSGQRLPGERELARQLGVSRPSVREALIALEIEGKVEVRVGTGVFVVDTPALAESEAHVGEGPFEIIRARWVIEGETAAMAALEATPAQKIEMRDAIEDLRTSRNSKESEDADRRLHVAIGEACGNGPLAEMVRMLWDQGRGALWKQMELHFSTPALWEQTLRDHTAVVDAIDEGDEAAARKAMHAHLTRVHREFARGFRPRRGRKSDSNERSQP